MTGNALYRFKLLWLRAWPLWTFLLLAALAAARFLPAGYARAAVAGPIVLMVPGSLTLGAVFTHRRRPQGLQFGCFAALLSVLWSAFASLALYACGIPIATNSTYICLLITSAFLAIVAGARFMFERPGEGRRVAHKVEPTDPDFSAAEADDASAPAAVKGVGYQAFVAAVAGAGLLAGGLYVYDRLPQPAPTGYTSMAWTGPHINGDLRVDSAGTELHFQIAHHQPGATAFRLTATWVSDPSRPLAQPVEFSIGAGRTFQGTVFVPPLPDGCVYRITVVLTAIHEMNHVTNALQTWSLNADVHDPTKPQRSCN